MRQFGFPPFWWPPPPAAAPPTINLAPRPPFPYPIPGMSESPVPGPSGSGDESSSQASLGQQQGQGRMRKAVEVDTTSDEVTESILGDQLTLLGEAEALEFVEFDPAIQPKDSWEPPKVILSFLEKHFNRALTEQEKEKIFLDLSVTHSQYQNWMIRSRTTSRGRVKIPSLAQRKHCSRSRRM